MRPTILLLAALASAQTLEYATLDGDRVAYASHGQGDQAVVFIHGWTCDHSFWKLDLPAFTRTRRVLLVDLPGHGQSAKPEIDYSVAHFARGVDAVMRAAGVKKAVLVGHSMGTPVALQFYRMFPEKTAGIGMIDGVIPRAQADTAAREKRLADMRLNEKRLADMRLNYESAAPKMVEAMFGARTTPALREEIRSKMLAAPKHVALGAMEGMLRMTLDTKARIDVPAWALLAARPQLTGYEGFLRGFIPKLDYEVWDGYGHFLMMEDPARFQKSLTAWLEKNGL
jgi:pimeloyl-ACP methyl ester carboxylesterase